MKHKKKSRTLFSGKLYLVVPYMLAREYAVNLTRKLMSDNQLDDGGKTLVTHLETFWGQSVKMTSQ